MRFQPREVAAGVSPSSDTGSLPTPPDPHLERLVVFAVEKLLPAMDIDEARSWVIPERLTYDDVHDAADALQKAAWRLEP